MLLPDVNVFVYAHRPESIRHSQTKQWLAAALGGVEPLAVSELVLSSFLRLVTSRSVFKDPTPLSVALEFCDTTLASPASVVVRPGTRHWALFAELCRDAQVKGNLVPDAYLAALCIEHGAALVTFDAGFRRFQRLKLAAIP